jgi:hypothetical protein
MVGKHKGLANPRDTSPGAEKLPVVEKYEK